ncbi:hypothetical protein SANBI_001673 [Sanguibacter sp. 4.1]|uniref:DUF11 domain-containing protein n=1 Tax=Sanguibacter biliveldensis TaxID=3030830 RepID=A0AAF0ZB37_9MICO|nr:hypothetical protein [Sanguibacter sp. 4.1]WPF83961.1 hypothetical protein SANBI_001673 [Sanguibacter sp. 4.1]
MLTAFNVLTQAQSAQAAPICEPGNITVNIGSGTPRLIQYSATGSVESEVAVPRSYTDIAYSSDGLTLYGILPGVPTLYTIDPATGVETASIPITGMPASGYFQNALSALPDGSLLTGAARNSDPVSQQIFRIDPTTGVATPFAASFPTGFGSAGDFLTLADGDVLAIGNGPAGNALFRIAPDATVTQVGTVPESFGAAQSGGRIYLAGSTGNLYEIASVPTAASTAPVATTTIASTGLPFFGATSQQDSGLCSELTIAKSSDPASGTAVALGQTVSYSITFANVNGTAPAEIDHTDDLSSVLDDATITAQPAVSDGSPLTIDPLVEDGFRVSGVIPAGGQTTITYAVTINDPATGDHQLSNYVIPTGGTPPTTCEPTNTACTTNPISDISVVKSVDPGQDSYEVGQELTYSFLVTNTGNVTLTDVTVNEGDFDGTGELGAITPAAVETLAAGESTTFTATYTLTQADIDRGSTTNTATATGVPPTGPPIESPPSTVEIPSAPTPALTVVKSVDPAGQDSYEVGQELTYSFLVTNSGNVTLTDVTVNEGEFDGTGELGAITPAAVETLAAGESATFTATYTLTQADIDRGSTTNTATATGVPPTGPPVESPPSTVEIPSAPTPALTVVKSADLTEITAAGQVVRYSFVVTNTGNVTVTDAAPVETEFSGTGDLGAITPESATLIPGQSATFTADYTVTQADVDGGVLTNTATAGGTPPPGTELPPVPPSTVEIPPVQTPALTIVKSVDPAGQDSYEVGQELTYSFLVTNTGNVTLTDVTVNEGEFDGTGELGAITPAAVETLAAGESATFTATYTLTQADIDRGSTTNTATATGVPPTGPPVESPPSTVEIPSAPTPALTVVKSADLTEITAAGQVVRYSFVVTNTGNVTVTDAAPVETEFSGTGDLGAITPESATLIPGQSATFTADYTVTQADVDGGVLTNTATAGGTPPPGTELPPVPPSTVEIPPVQTPALTIVKSVDPAGQDSYEVGQELTYSFLVTNTGNVTLTDVTVDEGEFDGTGELGAITPAAVETLAAGESTTFTATYTLTQADIDRGSTTNTATATGVPPTGPPIESPPSTVEIPSAPTPTLTIVKSVDPAGQDSYEVGQELTYSFLVTNTGNVTLTDVTVDEGEFDGTGELGAITPAAVETLAAGESTTFTATYTLTQADIDRGSTTNTATATGVPPTGPPIESPPSTVEIPSAPTPALTVVKSADLTEITAAGQVVRYSFVVTNTGNVTVTDAAPVETEFSGTGDLGAVSPASAALAPGESQTFTAQYTVTTADMAGPGLTNTATATGTPPPGSELPPVPSSTVTVPVVPASGLIPGLPVTGSALVGVAGIAFLLVLLGVAVLRTTGRREEP